MKKLVKILSMSVFAMTLIFASCSTDATLKTKSMKQNVVANKGVLDVTAMVADNSWAAGWGDEKYYAESIEDDEETEDVDETALKISVAGGWALTCTYTIGGCDFSNYDTITVEAYSDEEDPWVDEGGAFKVEFYTDDNHGSELTKDYEDGFLVLEGKTRKQTFEAELAKAGTLYSLDNAVDWTNINKIVLNPQACHGTMYIKSIVFSKSE